MGPILRLQPKLNIEQLYEQLDYSQGVLGKGREFVTQYLLDDGVDNLEESEEVFHESLGAGDFCIPYSYESDVG